MQLVKAIYDLTNPWPSEERFGLTNQIRRAAVSIPSNIAEGEGRGSDADCVRFLFISHGSLREVETHLEISRMLQYSNDEEISILLDECGEIGRMINGLIRTLRRERPSSLPTAD